MNQQANPSGADPRRQALAEFAAVHLGTVDSLEVASADASFRRYFRARIGAHSWIVMDAPPAHEPVDAFVRIAGRFRTLGLHVPEVFAEDREQGFLLLADLGTESYLEALTPSRVDRLYGDALGALVSLQVGGLSEPAFLPPYDDGRLRQELALFPEWYIERHLRATLTDAEQAMLEQLNEALIANALAQPQVYVHRDYHARNLMVTPRHNPGILDFQDAVCGPITYDLVSLLKDAYISWPRPRVVDWVSGYHTLALESGLVREEDPAVFLRWFDLMGVQRHLKVLGIFARLHHRDHKPRYLADLPRVGAYVTALIDLYPELAGFGALWARIGPP